MNWKPVLMHSFLVVWSLSGVLSTSQAQRTANLGTHERNRQIEHHKTTCKLENETSGLEEIGSWPLNLACFFKIFFKGPNKTVLNICREFCDGFDKKVSCSYFKNCHTANGFFNIQYFYEFEIRFLNMYFNSANECMCK